MELWNMPTFLQKGNIPSTSILNTTQSNDAVVLALEFGMVWFGLVLSHIKQYQIDFCNINSSILKNSV